LTPPHPTFECPGFEVATVCATTASANEEEDVVEEGNDNEGHDKSASNSGKCLEINEEVFSYALNKTPI
jgi:hypothetical protein